MSKPNTSTQITRHHYIRTIFAGLFGTLALVLVLASLLVVWANRTLTDTTTYVAAVAPLTAQPAVQEFVASKVTDQLLQAAPTQDLATTLLAPADVTGKTSDQLVAELTPVIKDSVTSVVGSPAFATLWRNTNQADHAQFIKQLDDNSPQITIDLGSFVTGVTNQLKATKLAPLSDKLDLKPSSAQLNLKTSQVEKLHKFYELFKTSTLAIVVITLVAIGLCILISVHHTKTLRRMLVGTGIISLIVAALIKLPSLIKPNGDDAVTQRAVVAVVTTLLHNLQLACLAIGIGCLILALGSKIYEQQHHK